MESPLLGTLCNLSSLPLNDDKLDSIVEFFALTDEAVRQRKAHLVLTMIMDSIRRMYFVNTRTFRTFTYPLYRSFFFSHLIVHHAYVWFVSIDESEHLQHNFVVAVTPSVGIGKKSIRIYRTERRNVGITEKTVFPEEGFGRRAKPSAPPALTDTETHAQFRSCEHAMFEYTKTIVSSLNIRAHLAHQDTTQTLELSSADTVYVGTGMLVSVIEHKPVLGGEAEMCVSVVQKTFLVHADDTMTWTCIDTHTGRASAEALQAMYHLPQETEMTGDRKTIKSDGKLVTKTAQEIVAIKDRLEKASTVSLVKVEYGELFLFLPGITNTLPFYLQSGFVLDAITAPATSTVSHMIQRTYMQLQVAVLRMCTDILALKDKMRTRSDLDSFLARYMMPDRPQMDSSDRFCLYRDPTSTEFSQTDIKNNRVHDIDVYVRIVVDFVLATSRHGSIGMMEIDAGPVLKRRRLCISFPILCGSMYRDTISPKVVLSLAETNNILPRITISLEKGRTIRISSGDYTYYFDIVGDWKFCKHHAGILHPLSSLQQLSPVHNATRQGLLTHYDSEVCDLGAFRGNVDQPEFTAVQNSLARHAVMETVVIHAHHDANVDGMVEYPDHSTEPHRRALKAGRVEMYADKKEYDVHSVDDEMFHDARFAFRVAITPENDCARMHVPPI